MKMSKFEYWDAVEWVTMFMLAGVAGVGLWLGFLFLATT